MVPDQALPVYYTLRAQLTTGTVGFSSTSIDFGDTYITHATSRTVTLTNESLLPQRFGFVNIPPEIEVQPFNGFGELLPKESRDIELIFKPESAIEYEFKVQAINTYGVSEMSEPTPIVRMPGLPYWAKNEVEEGGLERPRITDVKARSVTLNWSKAEANYSELVRSTPLH